MICQKCKRQYKDVQTYGPLASSMNTRLCLNCDASINSPIFLDGDFNPDSYENRVRRSKGKGRQQPSVSPGDGGEVRQRRTPKPGIPHFRISWHPITGKPWFLWQNKEAKQWHITLLLTSEDYQYFRGGITPRLKPR